MDTRIIPRAAVTIKIKEVFKDNYGLDSELITVYDRYVKNAIGKVNGEKARFVSQDTIDYQIGDKGIFLIENDRGLWIQGFTSFYLIEDGRYTIESEYDKKYDRGSIELQEAKETAKVKDKEKDQ